MNSKASRVLIVDDMPINRMILSSLLATNGVLSDQAEGGRECLNLCEKKDYDLILLDHRMPELDGVDTLVALKDLFEKKKRSIPVICHTTEEGRNNINLYKAAGFADVLIKPIDPRQLSTVLMTYLPEEDKLSALDEAEAAMPESPEDESLSEVDVRDELDKLPLWLKTVPHIDLVAGINNCGDAADYLDALYVFYSSITEKADDIESYLDQEELTMFKLSVHSLKSMARLVGARVLCEYARNLEGAAERSDMTTIRRDTPHLLGAYRHFAHLLAPLRDDEAIRRIRNEEALEPEPKAPAQEQANPCRSILFIHSNQGIVITGIENNLREGGFTVISIPDEPDMIITCRFRADIIVYYPKNDDQSHIGLTMNLLGEICQDDSKILCLTGEGADLDQAMAANGAHRVCRSYPRPLNIHRFLRDMDNFSQLLEEYHRTKTLYVVDDDPDYLSVINHWLSGSYHVSSFQSGQSLIDGLKAATPDLILLDYEMPNMDGYEIMKRIRTDPATQMIPIIFLTGKNDRDHVLKILEYKPDGYLLKNSQKEALLDAINRFFSETLFRDIVD